MPRTKKEVDSSTVEKPVKDSSKKSTESTKKTTSKSKTVANPRKIFAEINKVEGLDTSKLIKPYVDPITGETTEDGFMPVKDRISWFRLVYPKGRIIPDTIAVTKDYVRCKAEIYLDDNPDSVPIAVGSAIIEFSNPVYGGNIAFNSAETCAIGRALSFAGFGTQASGGELETPVVDAGEPMNTVNHSTTDVVEDEDVSKEEVVEDNPETDESAVEGVVDEKPFEISQETPENSREEFDKKVKYLLENEMNGSLANGCLITYGDLRNKTVKDAFVELSEKGKNPIEALSKYLEPEDPKPEYAIISAACAYYIKKFNEKKQ